MTKLHLALIGLTQQKQPQKVNAVVWEQNIGTSETANGVAAVNGLTCDVSNLDIFDLIRKKSINENFLERLRQKLQGLNFIIDGNAHKLKTMQLSTANFEKELAYLESAVASIQLQYDGYSDRAASLAEKVKYAAQIAGSVDEAKLLRLETTFAVQKKALVFLNELRDAADQGQIALVVAKNQTNSAANKATILVENIKNRVANYNKLLLDIDRRIAAIIKLSLNVNKNAFSGEFMLEVMINSFEKLQEKQEQRKQKIKEFNNTLTFLITFCKKMQTEVLILERDLNDLLLDFDRIKCGIESKASTLTEIEKQCDMAGATLDEYFDLLVGCNFIAAGSNIRLNREGCSCVISAVQPELEECPQVPISPSIPADVFIKEGKLPVCPPQMCPSTPESAPCAEAAPCPDCPTPAPATTTTNAPDTTTTTTTTTESPTIGCLYIINYHGSCGFTNLGYDCDKDSRICAARNNIQGNTSSAYATGLSELQNINCPICRNTTNNPGVLSSAIYWFPDCNATTFSQMAPFELSEIEASGGVKVGTCY